MTSPVRSVTRAFAVLQVVAASPRSASLAQITKATGLPKSSVSRMLSTLEHLEIVEQAGGRGRYRVGPALGLLTGGGTSPQTLKHMSRPHLESLVSQLGEDANLAAPEGDKVLYMSQVTADRAVRVQDWTGYTLPCHTVAAGFIFLSAWDPERLETHMARGLARSTANTVADPSALRAKLEKVRRQGYAWAVGEYADELNSVAAPVTGPHGMVVAALSVHGPSYRFPAQGEESEVGRLVSETAARLTGDLAGGP